MSSTIIFIFIICNLVIAQRAKHRPDSISPSDVTCLYLQTRKRNVRKAGNRKYKRSRVCCFRVIHMSCHPGHGMMFVKRILLC